MTLLSYRCDFGVFISVSIGAKVIKNRSSIAKVIVENKVVFFPDTVYIKQIVTVPRVH